jgi:hypothetical protein
MREYGSCLQPTKSQDRTPLLDECPHCGDKPLEHDDTGHVEQLFIYEMSSSDDQESSSDEENVEEHITRLREESASAKKERRRPITFWNKICKSFGV